MGSETKLLRVDEFSTRVVMSLPWTRKKIACREITVYRIGRSIRIPETEVARILNDGIVPAVEVR